MNYSIRLLLLLMCGAAVVTAGAQDRLVLTSGDTLRGNIELLLPGDLYEEVTFENDEMKERYKGHEIVSMVQDGIPYRTIKFGEKYRLMQVETDGYLSLLKFRSDKSYTYNAHFLYKRSGEGTEVPNFLFKKSMANFLDDCGPVKEAIAEGVYRKKDMNALVAAYNQCMDAKTEDRMEQYRISQKRATNSPLIDEFTNLQKQADQMNDKELASMLNDVVEKLKSGENVPKYLQNALLEHVRDGHSLKQGVEVLVGQL